jgi:NAD(P)H-nitrite reductase large subunit
MARLGVGSVSKRKHLIIGCGTAGLSAVEQIRKLSSEDEIKVVTMENYAPYSIAALPYLLSGKMGEANLLIKGDDYFNRTKVAFVKGKKVVRILPDTRKVIYEDGGQEKYDTLLIASGSEAAVPNIEGIGKVSPLSFHIFEDYRLLKKRLINKKTVAIYGGGLIALEIIVPLLEAGYAVKVLIRSRILRQYFDQEIGDKIQDILISKGAQIYRNCAIGALRGNRERVEITLSDGTSLDADVFIVCTGVKARNTFLQESGIEINKGIRVNRRMMTNIKDIYASGDVAEATSFFDGRSEMSPIIISAVEQGKIAGSNMVGKAVDYEGSISANIFSFFGNRAFSVGITIPTDKRCQVINDNKETHIKKLVFRDNKLVGATGLNVDLDPGIILYFIREKVDIGPYKEILFEQPKDIGRWLMIEAERGKISSRRV